MSRPETYPGLTALAKANGINYITALARVNRGWSIERATSEPPRPKRPTRTLEERREYYASKGIKRRLTPRGRARERIVAPPKDTAPAHIRRLRAAYCDEFIKTGEINVGFLTLLKDYARACRKPNPSAQRVSPKHEAQDDHSRGPSLRPDGDRDDNQPHVSPAE